MASLKTMSYAEMDLAIVPDAPPAWKNSRATSWPAPISANVPYFGGSRFMVRAFWAVVRRSLFSPMPRTLAGGLGVATRSCVTSPRRRIGLEEAMKQASFAASMKNFITSMLGAFVALVIFTTGGVLLFIGFIGAIVAMGTQKKAPEVVDGSYLVLDLSANITDAPPAVDFGGFTGGRSETLQLRSVTRALRYASHDSRIKGV